MSEGAGEGVVDRLGGVTGLFAALVCFAPIFDELAIVVVHRMLPRALLRLHVVEVDLALVVGVLREVGRQRRLNAILGDPQQVGFGRGLNANVDGILENLLRVEAIEGVCVDAA